LLPITCEAKVFYRDANDVEHFIAYAEKSHWLGGKNISLNLDVGKTIFNRQTKLVLHNTSKL